jgi:DNA-binding Lrp family transcriptional regulator
MRQTRRKNVTSSTVQTSCETSLLSRQNSAESILLIGQAEIRETFFADLLMAPRIDNLDKRLLNALQRGVPIAKRPYRALARQLEISEQELISRTRRLREKGIIRRLGVVFDTHKLGFASVLVAMHVPGNRIKRVAEIINEYPGVSHNYQRHHLYNLWFTLSAPSKHSLHKLISEIKRRTRIGDLKLFPARRVFKIALQLEV